MNTQGFTRMKRGLINIGVKKWCLIVFILILFLAFSYFVFAHTEDAELNQEIQKGKEIVEKFYRGEIKCQNLSNEDFHAVGEYIMEQVVGGSDHLTMNKMIEQMHGKEGEELMHINMEKRFLGCDGNTTGWIMPMMSGGMPMMGYWGFWNWQGWNFLAPIWGIIGGLWLLVILSFPVLVLILLILSIIYLIKKLKAEIKKDNQLRL